MNRQMMWMDRNGDLLGTIGPADSDSPGIPRVSPDGRTVVYFRQVGAALGSVWVTDTATGAKRQLQDGANVGIWSPTGDRILFAALQGTGGRGAQMLARSINDPAGSGTGVRIGPTSGQAFPEDWSSTGAVVYRSGPGSGQGGGDLFVVMEGQSNGTPVAQTLASEKNARFSPDGKWIAYQSDEGGRNEVYIQPFPGAMEQRQRLSLNGGTSPQWGRKGQELYFVSGDNRLMVATATIDKAVIEFGTPKPLFKGPLPQGVEYSVSGDGDRFLLLAPVEEPPPIVVISNWMPGGR
jgi:Tol biopolymer transport system component